MKKEDIKKFSLKELKEQKDKGLSKTRADAPEYAVDSDFWDNAQLVSHKNKKSVHLRIDEEVFEWFKTLGPGHLTRMNSVLRSYYESQNKGNASHKIKAVGIFDEDSLEHVSLVSAGDLVKLIAESYNNSQSAVARGSFSIAGDTNFTDNFYIPLLRNPGDRFTACRSAGEIFEEEYTASTITTGVGSYTTSKDKPASAKKKAETVLTKK